MAFEPLCVAVHQMVPWANVSPVADHATPLILTCTQVVGSNTYCSGIGTGDAVDGLIDVDLGPAHSAFQPHLREFSCIGGHAHARVPMCHAIHRPDDSTGQTMATATLHITQLGDFRLCYRPRGKEWSPVGSGNSGLLSVIRPCSGCDIANTALAAIEVRSAYE